MAVVRAIAQEEFDSQVGSAPGLVLVDFWATWCGPCKQQAPVLDALAADLDGTVDVVKVDVDSAPALVARFGLSSVPTLLVFRGGEPVARMNGAGGRAQLLELLASAGFTG